MRAFSTCGAVALGHNGVDGVTYLLLVIGVLVLSSRYEVITVAYSGAMLASNVRWRPFFALESPDKGLA